MRTSGIEKYFTAIYFAQQDKDALYTIALSRLSLPTKNIAIVDDRVIRGIQWGNVFGATTIWLKRGKFMSEEPNKETGKPTYIISNLEDIRSLHL